MKDFYSFLILRFFLRVFFDYFLGFALPCTFFLRYKKRALFYWRLLLDFFFFPSIHGAYTRQSKLSIKIKFLIGQINSQVFH